MKRITYCYVDGVGKEQIGIMDGEKGNVGYQIDEHTARIWMTVGGKSESETQVIPISRLVFIREVTNVIEFVE